jgi:hypothetical protein
MFVRGELVCAAPHDRIRYTAILIENPSFIEALKPERFDCGCSLEWDGEKVSVKICEWHRNETKKLKIK